jgi:hypothetical protein
MGSPPGIWPTTDIPRSASWKIEEIAIAPITLSAWASSYVQELRDRRKGGFEAELGATRAFINLSDTFVTHNRTKKISGFTTLIGKF